MSIRGVLRGEVGDDHLSAVAEAVSRRYGPPEPVAGSPAPDSAPGNAGVAPGPGDGAGADDAVASRGGPTVRRVPADNWLSEPAVVADRWFVKVVADRHVRVHALLTAARNLGARAVGAPPFFEGVGSPVELVTRQHAALRRFRAVGVRTPRPVGAFEHEGLGVLVLTYLTGFRTVDDCEPAVVRRVAPDLFAALARLHEAGGAHGDVRAENLLVADGTLHLIDPTTLARGAVVAADYDVACALATLAPLIGPADAVRAARTALGPGPLAATGPLLEFVELRPDHEFDRPALRAALGGSVGDPPEEAARSSEAPRSPAGRDGDDIGEDSGSATRPL